MPNLAHYSTYTESSLIPTANLMLNYILKPIHHESFYKKYAGKWFLKVSMTTTVGGKSLEGVKYGVHPRRLGLAGLGELRGLERRSVLEGSGSQESREGVRSTAKCAGNAQLESLGVA